MSGQHKQPLSQTSYEAHIPNSLQAHDAIDLRELFKALWDGKFIIIVITFAFSLGAVIYVLTAQQWWSSKGQIAQPQPQDISAYQQQVKQFQPVFDTYQEDGTVLVSTELNELVDTEVLFQRFVDAFNSSNNKRAFLNTSEEFQVFKAKFELGIDGESEAAKEVKRKLYSTWFEKITAEAVDKTLEVSPYDISFQATTKQSSYNLLSAYLEAIKHQVHQDALNNLQSIVDGKRNELIQLKRILENQASQKLSVESTRAKYALEIAQAAGVNKPIQTNSTNELFSIDMGAQALEAKVKLLESVKDLNVVEPRLQQIDAKLDMLAEMNVDRNVKFQTFRFLEDIEQPVARDKPKRFLIVMLGTLLGGMLGVTIVVVRLVFHREQLN